MPPEPRHSDATFLLRARWIFRAGEPPIEDGLIGIHCGFISSVNSGPQADAVDLGEVAILPSLVNAHTHLEFSDLEHPLRPVSPFAEWIRAVVRDRRARGESPEQAIHQGVQESIAAGTGGLGEIATSSLSARVLDQTLPASTVFFEVLGLDETAFADRQQAAREHLESGAESATGCVRGLSPHAPYTLHPELFRWTVETALAHEAPVAMHLAETREELELLRNGSGPLVEMLRDLGVWRQGILKSMDGVLSFLETMSPLQRVLVIHGNFLSDKEIAFLEDHPQFSVIYCPRTHAYFSHQPHPWRRLLERGVNVALGTDSRASNVDLNLWREVQYLHRLAPDAPGETLLRMATTNGAAALGTDAAADLRAGHPADLIVVELGDSETPDPWQKLLHPKSRVIGVMHHGRWVTAPEFAER